MSLGSSSAFTRTFLSNEVNTMTVVDIGIAAFLVFSGRALFSKRRPLAGNLFFGAMYFTVLLLYSQLLFLHMFPAIDYVILLPSTTAVSLALATAGEKLIKINRNKKLISKAYDWK